MDFKNAEHANLFNSGSSEIKPFKIGSYTFSEFCETVKSFHGYPAPGVLIGGIMVELALSKLPPNILFNAYCETYSCLPDAIQLLTPCKTGNGWLTILNYSKYALCLYEKYEGKGIRVALDAEKLEKWSEIKNWFFKLKSKSEQNKEALLDEIKTAGFSIYSTQEVFIQPQYLKKQSKGKIVICPICSEAFPEKHGRICRACQHDTPYHFDQEKHNIPFDYSQSLDKIPVKDSVGMEALHDMTEIIAGESKGPAFKRGEVITPGDICRLQKMGRQNIYVPKKDGIQGDMIHENEAALSFASAIAGEGVSFIEPPKEGKIDLVAEKDGLLIVDQYRLEAFNMIPGVICATRKSYSIVSKGRKIAGTRAIPLFLPQREFSQAMNILSDGHLIKVLSIRKAKVGILVTGTEIFQGLVKDKFIPIISTKIANMGCELVKSHIVPDQRQAIAEGITDLIKSGADLIVTTAGLSVDPDDVTRQGLSDAGAHDILYGMPVIPGAMTLLSHIGSIQVIGVPACALFYKTTSFDLLMPRLLAGIRITRRDLARMGHGSLCWECKTCTYPKCSFGKD